ncbi:MAG: hypothetical protein Q4B70_10165, partial [Lachnospiraceae bacterium]|nr:hypothetical protein [Lachnospiraceae bacterium]
PVAIGTGLKYLDLADDSALALGAIPAGFGFDTTIGTSLLSGDVSNLFQRNTKFKEANALTPQFVENSLTYLVGEVPAEMSAGYGFGDTMKLPKAPDSFAYGKGLAVPITTKTDGVFYHMDGSKPGYVYEPKEFMTSAKDALDSINPSDISLNTPIDARTNKPMSERDYVSSIRPNAKGEDIVLDFKKEVLEQAKKDTLNINERLLNQSDLEVYPRLILNPIRKQLGLNPKEPTIKPFRDVFDSTMNKAIKQGSIDMSARSMRPDRKTPQASIKERTSQAAASFKSRLPSILDVSPTVKIPMDLRKINFASSSRTPATMNAYLDITDRIPASLKSDVKINSRVPSITSNRIAVTDRLPAQIKQEITLKGEKRLTPKADLKSDLKDELKLDIRLAADFRKKPKDKDEKKEKTDGRKSSKSKLNLKRDEYIFKNPFE